MLAQAGQNKSHTSPGAVEVLDSTPGLQNPNPPRPYGPCSRAQPSNQLLLTLAVWPKPALPHSLHPYVVLLFSPADVVHQQQACSLRKAPVTACALRHRPYRVAREAPMWPVLHPSKADAQMDELLGLYIVGTVELCANVLYAAQAAADPCAVPARRTGLLELAAFDTVLCCSCTDSYSSPQVRTPWMCPDSPKTTGIRPNMYRRVVPSAQLGPLVAPRALYGTHAVRHLET